ncbi:uncharacterized protein METZ01_LOCUS462452, partial [marine metagenome]
MKLLIKLIKMSLPLLTQQNNYIL